MHQLKESTEHTREAVLRPDEVGYWAISLAAKVMTGITRALAPYELSAAQFFILETCFRGEADTVTRLSHVLPYDQAHISRQTDELRSKGLLAKRRLRRDRRVVRLSLTEAGRALVSVAAPVAMAQDMHMTSAITEEEKKRFVSITRRILAGL